MANQGSLSPEGMYWWGKAWMLQGEPEDAEMALRQALELAGKKSKWKGQAELALAQCQDMPVAFDVRQLLQKTDAVAVPLTSFHRYVHWEREGVRLMLAPDEVQSKLDRKRGVTSPVTFWRGTGEVLYHSLGAKGARGLDIWLGQLNEEGEFAELTPLPDNVNSPYDEINPVWDEAAGCLYFASNRPGTVGGMDIFRSCQIDGTWEDPESLGPTYNSVLDDWAYYPGEADTGSWLVTGRDAHYGGAEVWEVVPDGPPKAPIVLTTQWDIGEDIVPGTLRLSDAETGQALATVELSQGRGMWDLVVASGQVLRYAFESESGELVEGTYALPEVGQAAALTQTMIMSEVEGAPFMEAKPLSKKALPMPSLKWGWDMVINEVQTLEVQTWAVEEETPLVAEESIQPARRIVQFNSYPWWTETQQEERAIASNFLSTYVPNPRIFWPEASNYNNMASYRDAIESLNEATIDHAVNAVLALASVDVLKDETPWEEALKKAMLQASELWEIGSLNVEVVGRKAQRNWAQAGAMYDQGALPEVRDKRGLVGDGVWVEEPWVNGQVAQLADLHKRARNHSPVALKVAWHVAQSNVAEQTWNAKWEDPALWDATSIRTDRFAEHPPSLEATNGLAFSSTDVEEDPSTTLQEMRLRLAILESLEPSAELSEEEILAMVRHWRGLAVEVAQMAGQGNDPSMGASAAVSTSSKVDATREDPQHGGQDEHAPSVVDLNRDWAVVWDKVISLVDRNQGGFTEEVSSLTVMSENVVESGEEEPDAWRLELSDWLKTTLENRNPAPHDLNSSGNPRIRPLDMLEAMVQHFEMDKPERTESGSVSEGTMSHSTASPDSVSTARDLRKLALLDQIKNRAADAQFQEETATMVQSFWAIASWLHNPDWQDRSPDQLLALNDSWLADTRQELESWSVEWAKSAQRQGSTTNAEGIGEEEEMAVVTVADDGESEMNASSPQADLVQLDAPTTDVLELGAHGLHLGWFKNNPKLAGLPSGMQLESEMGKQGLRRWVLILPQDVGELKMTALSNWLLQAGLGDAYDVHWHGDSWRKEPYLEFVDAWRQVEEQEALAPSELRVGGSGTQDQGKPVEMTTEDKSPTTTMVSEPRKTNSRDASPSGDSTRGGAMEWQHGAPIELGDLIGVWFAVQVGAFRGQPEKAWVEQAGERLVYEPFEDGLARWYAGVRQDVASTRERWDELMALTGFEDAFVVQLRNGRRELMASADEVVVHQAEPKIVRADMTGTWHIAIAKYYGTVPSRDVASLLFKAAHWGVRSVELSGQTTYMSRSVLDLADAEMLLKEIRAEGFVNATIVQE